jgi:hypothetical protein
VLRTTKTREGKKGGAKRDDEKVFESLYCAGEMGISCGGKGEGELPEESEAHIECDANLYE